MQRDDAWLNYHCSLDPIARVHWAIKKPPNAAASGGLFLAFESSVSVS
jgi:hypothetical protein